MTKFRKRPVVIEATRWFENGDHPDDRVGETLTDSMSGSDYLGQRQEGAVVRYFHHPAYSGAVVHKPCGNTWNEHGWVDTLEGGHIVCPGDWIITGVAGERYPCKDSIFHQTYESV